MSDHLTLSLPREFFVLSLRQEFVAIPRLAFPSFSVLLRIKVLLLLQLALMDSSKARFHIIFIIRGVYTLLLTGTHAHAIRH